mmetsp:Transcript_12331/g.15381  ORF Transcript_12331/g.15381 Transcript_12331/m.15381 type:complete len:102 (+) Transcript_12331:506-811(+)
MRVKNGGVFPRWKGLGIIFKAHFSEAYNDSWLYAATVDFGYSVNHASGVETEEFLQDMQEVLTNLAHAAMADKALMEQLVKNNTKLVAQLEILTAQLIGKK